MLLRRPAYFLVTATSLVEEHFRIHDSSENPSPVDCPGALNNNDEILTTEANKENQSVSDNLSPVPGCSQDMQG
jgi:hypothetical protein